MRKENYFLEIADGAELWIDRWLPDEGKEIRGIIQFHIGMEEWTGRYDQLGTFFSDAGFVFNTYDFRGHGITAQNAEKKRKGLMGKIADKEGFNRAIEDLHCVIQNCTQNLPSHLKDKVVLIGYSFGSFVCQGFIEKYGTEIAACVLCGTKGPTQFINWISTLVGRIDCLFGRDKKASVLERFPDKMYAKRVSKEIAKKNRLAWMCADQSVVEAYIADPLCSNGFVRSFFVDMMGGCLQIHKRKNMRKIPTELPVLFVYGSDDPVGAYGKTIRKLEELYKKNGMLSVEEKVYKGCRHEVFQDYCKEEAMKDILSWAEKKLCLENNI
ncbi:MAG TPA: alpha/beta hydrolase [Treponema sp.]|nr:alpha/beta hydrolase [Treponema sp.]